MKYRVISRQVVDNFVVDNFMRNKYTIRQMLEIMEKAGFVTTFNGKIQNAKNYIYTKAIETGNAYLIYRNYTHYGTYVYDIESKKLLKVF